MVEKLIAKKIVPYIISCVFFMEAIDSTVINTAIPAISQSLHVGPVDLKIALISYLLSLSIFIPISGWLADKLGAKKIFMLALFIFTLSSLWCGFAQNITELNIARFAQGFGSAFGLPVGRLIIIRTFGRQNLIVQMNRVITIAALGIMFGPVVGGFITSHFSWQWIFWVNIPIGLITFVLAYYYLERSETYPVPPLDKVGFLLFGTGLAGFTFGLSALSETGIDLSMAYSIILIAILFLIAYVLHAHHRPHSIVKTDLLRLKTFQISVASNFLSRLGFGGVPFLLPLLFQVNFGLSSQLSGILLAPIAFGILVSKPLALHLLRLFGYKHILIINTLCSALTIALFICINANTSFYLIGLLTFIYGFILALQYSAMNSLAYTDINAEDLSAATSIMGTVQQLTQSFGVAICALLIRLFSSIDAEHTLTLSVFHRTFIVMAILTLSSSFIFLRLRPDDGQAMINHS